MELKKLKLMEVPEIKPINVPKRQSLQEWHFANGSVPERYKGNPHAWHKKVQRLAEGGSVYNTQPDMNDGGQIIPEQHMGRGGAAKAKPFKASDLAEPFTEGLFPMIYGGAKGTVAGLAGLPGELESLARAGYNYGSRLSPQAPLSRETFFPTIEEVSRALPSTGRKIEEPYTKLGENMLSGLVNPAAVYRTGARGVNALRPTLGNVTDRYMTEMGMMPGVAPKGTPAPKGESPIIVTTKAEREHQGALRPDKSPKRGKTSEELTKAQNKQLSSEQKEVLEKYKQKYPDFASSVQFMTPQEVSKIIASNQGVQEVDRLLKILPQAKEISSITKAGQAKQGWYRASTQALIDVFGDDAPRFASLLAAMSPQTSVEMNLLNTLNTWKNWEAAGRPTQPAAIKAIMGQSVLGNKGEESVLQAWQNNATRALSSPDPTKVTLSGPKVDSFYRNLSDDVYRVTNDAWMANGLGVDQGLFSGSPTAKQLLGGDPGLTPGYISTNARMREAGQQSKMYPSEAQETAWSFFMPLYEMQAATGLGARDILQKGLLRPEHIRGTPDFSTLLNSPQYKDILESAGYGRELSALKPHEWPEPKFRLSTSEQEEVLRAAKRLEELKANRGRETGAKTISLPKSYNESPSTGYAFATPEYIPGVGTGHLEGLIDAPIGTRENFSNKAAMAFKNIQGRDLLQGSQQGLHPLQVRSGLGAFRPEGGIPFGGNIRQAPTTNRFQMETQPMYPTGAEVPIVETKNIPNVPDPDIPQYIKDQLTAVEALRGSMTAQRGSPWNLQIPYEHGESFYVPLKKKIGRDEMGASASLQEGDTAIADTGRGASVLNFGDRFTKKEKDLIAQRLGGTEHFPTKNISDYVDYSNEWLQPPGSGAVTRKMLSQTGKLKPEDLNALSNAAKDPAGLLHDLYEQSSRTRNEPTREDLMRLLKTIRDKGLPGVAAGLAAGEAFPAGQPKKKGGLAVLRRSRGRA
jgi:hypothetical protein